MGGPRFVITGTTLAAVLAAGLLAAATPGSTGTHGAATRGASTHGGGGEPAQAITATGSGAGRLAQVIATRGGLAAPEAPFVIEHQEVLICMLCEAAELEHGIMCQYLFAAFSLKQDSGEGLSGQELEARASTRSGRSWRPRSARQNVTST